MPGLVHRHVNFWLDATLHGQPIRDRLVSYVRDGINVRNVHLDAYRGPSTDSPCDAARFPGGVFLKRIPPLLTDFMDAEVQALVDRG